MRARLDFKRKKVPADLGAALAMALAGIPDAIASAILAGVNPANGCNALIVGLPLAACLPARTS